jgi:RimJ/RimL family protein N-acetyltransferase
VTDTDDERTTRLHAAGARDARVQVHLDSRRVVLRPITQRDYDFLYTLSVHPEITFYWRFKGGTPPPEQFPQLLWQGVLCQFLITDRRGRPAGIITAYNADLQSKYVWLAIMMTPEATDGLMTHDALVLFLNYLFQGWGFRKVYGESSERNVASFYGAYSIERGLVTIEGRLKEHELFAGRYWDYLTLAMYRSTWEPIIDRRMPVIRRGMSGADVEVIS